MNESIKISQSIHEPRKYIVLNLISVSVLRKITNHKCYFPILDKEVRFSGFYLRRRRQSVPRTMFCGHLMMTTEILFVRLGA